MFSQKLDILMKEMDATNTDVAECAGFDRTNITRFRNGSRFPDPSSRSAIRLIDGLFLYARDRGRLADLCVTPGIDPLETEEKIKHELHEWLYKDDPLLKDGRRNRRGRRKKSLGEEPGDDHFGVRLTEAMKLAEISNISLSRMLNVDPSLISRYRSGMCMPRSESVDPLVDILFRRIGSNEREEELILLMDCKRSDLNKKTFADWLFGFGVDIQKDGSPAAGFFKIFESYDPNTDDKFFFNGLTPAYYLCDNRNVYTGVSGLQEAVLKFLIMACELKGQEMLLYSDQDMSWMMGPEDFCIKWAVLMKRCVKSGIKIRIIHNIDRSPREMDMAVRSWLPLYMSGMVEPFYSEAVKDIRFFHTLFVCPGVAAIEGSGASGAEDNAIYHFYTDEQCIDASIAGFNRLLESARPLLG